MAIDMSQFYQVFFDESAEQLGEMERLLLGIDIDHPDMEQLNAIFRAAHSIKGGSGTFGFMDMTSVTHILETLLDRLRKGEMTPRVEMVDAFLEAADVLKDQLTCHINGTDADESLAEAICEKLRLLTQDQAPSPAKIKNKSRTAAKPTPSTPATRTYTIGFTLDNRQGNAGDTFEILLQELSRLGSIETLEQPELQQLAPHKEKAEKKNKSKKSKDKKENSRNKPTKKKGNSVPLFWKLQLVTTADEEAIRGALEFIVDPDLISIETLDDSSLQNATIEEDQGYGFFTELPSISVQENAQGSGFLVDIIPPSEEEPAEVATSAKVPVPQKRASDNTASIEQSSIRVSVEKVDQLINLVGELIITQAMLTQTASNVDPAIYETLFTGMAQLERNSRDLQEAVLSIRMMPISFVFSRFPRVVRDLASKLGKQVELVTIGENTELDKGLIERIADPLTHLVRNSLDHGIEAPENRIATGKPAKGTITLSASHQGGSIVIEVSDDGAGLNREKILSKAIERGLVVSETMSDSEVWMLIFEPGFSTAEVVTDVSGRGVGMDVVRRNISEMGGNVEIESIYGHGTKIRVRLPLTLAILDGMTVALGDSIYIIPLNMILETLQPAAADLKTVTGQGQVVNVRGEYLPLIALYKIFNHVPQFTYPTDGVLVIIEDKGKKSALLIDSLIGQQQVVVKSLETNYRKVPGVSGATIMGDGRVALIIDVPALIKIGQSIG